MRSYCLENLKPLVERLGLFEVLFERKFGELELGTSLLQLGAERVLEELAGIEVEVLTPQSIFTNAERVVTLADSGFVVVFQEGLLLDFVLVMRVEAVGSELAQTS